MSAHREMACWRAKLRTRACVEKCVGTETGLGTTHMASNWALSVMGPWPEVLERCGERRTWGVVQA